MAPRLASSCLVGCTHDIIGVGYLPRSRRVRSMLCIGYSASYIARERDSYVTRSMNHRTVEIEYYNQLVVLSTRGEPQLT